MGLRGNCMCKGAVARERESSGKPQKGKKSPDRGESWVEKEPNQICVNKDYTG